MRRLLRRNPANWGYPDDRFFMPAGMERFRRSPEVLPAVLRVCRPVHRTLGTARGGLLVLEHRRRAEQPVDEWRTHFRRLSRHLSGDGAGDPATAGLSRRTASNWWPVRGWLSAVLVRLDLAIRRGSGQF